MDSLTWFMQNKVNKISNNFILNLKLQLGHYINSVLLLNE